MSHRSYLPGCTHKGKHEREGGKEHASAHLGPSPPIVASLQFYLLILWNNCLRIRKGHAPAHQGLSLPIGIFPIVLFAYLLYEITALEGPRLP